tara:strand:- start:9832 stop:10098 length:267 start_codon:yes stop_codon:yes gene_type:complete
MSRIKEGLIGYDEPNEWIEPTSLEMVDELVEYQVYCMSLSELTQRVIRQVREEYYTQHVDVMRQEYLKAFGNKSPVTAEGYEAKGYKK